MKAEKITCKVTDHHWLTPTVFQLSFVPEKPIEFLAGQFVSVIIPGAGPKGRNLRRAYSIASVPEQETIELCITLVEGGPGSNYLNGLRPGDTLTVVAPYGDFIFKTPAHRDACFIATGTGVAPFRSMVLSQQYKDSPPRSSRFIFGVRNIKEILYRDEVTSQVDTLWITALSREDQPHEEFKGRVTRYIQEANHGIDWANTDFYLCGNGDMISEVRDYLMEKRSVSKDAVFLEKYY